MLSPVSGLSRASQLGRDLHGTQDLHQRPALRQRRRQDQRLRSRLSLRRRRVRGAAQLRRQGVSPGRASRPAVELGQGHPAGNPHVARGHGQGRHRHAGGQQHSGRLHPPGRHPRRRQPGARPQSHQQSAGHDHHRQDLALSRRALSERAGDRHRQHACAIIRPRSARESSRSIT